MEATDEDYAGGYEWHALVTDLDMDARDVLPLYRERGDVASASRLGTEQRRHLITAYAFREYGTIRRLFPPDIGGQITMPPT